MEGILNKINISLLLLLLVSFTFSIYGVYSIVFTKGQINANIADEVTKQNLITTYNNSIILITFLLCLLTICILSIIFRLRRYVEIKQNAMFDQLTKLYNRHYFTKRFEEEIERSKRFKHSLSVLMLDIDDFKKYNDRFGHTKGDNLLKVVAEIMGNSVRKIDVIGRWGGEEFIVILPETKGRDAFIVAERIRSHIVNQTHTSVSIGLIYYRYYYPEIKEIIEKVDSLMYKAKQMGKNRICYN